MTQQIKDTCQVSDLSDFHALVAVDYEIAELLKSEGLEDWLDDAGCLFVLTGNCEMQEIWVCKYSIPEDHDTVYRAF